MKNLKYLFLAGISAMILTGSCYYDSEEYLFGVPGGNCADTTVFTYTAGVQPILSQYCYSCHSNGSAASMGGNIKLQDFADVKTVASNGKLTGSVSHASGFSPMPKGGNKLNDCYIVVIKKWIAAGALNN